ncbi:hypothetical protein EB796_016195 [Bugula neritina]|uniref:Uncharacterized protein n=1 Tax=Bugula neritina TaxID=10212 RepID=A0A7J7JIZ8_BUGNE|nr:hypothetical protein EB796_016195 [Bugula neritina]
MTSQKITLAVTVTANRNSKESDSTSSESTEDSSNTFSTQSGAGGTPSAENTDNMFTSFHDRIFNMHARNIHSRLWNSTSFDFHSVHNNRRRNASSMGHSAHAPQNIRSTSITTKFVDGKKIVTKIVTENGMETTTIEENGFITSQTVSPVC